MEEMENYLFLKNLITEDLYLVKEKVGGGADLSGLAESPAQPAAKPAAAPASGVLIVLKQRINDLEPSQKTLLVRIMAAVKVDLTIETVMHDPEYRSNPAIAAGYQKVIAFGGELAECKAKYQVVAKGEQKFLSSDSLAALDQAVALKEKLWRALREMFGHE